VAGPLSVEFLALDGLAESEAKAKATEMSDERGEEVKVIAEPMAGVVGTPSPKLSFSNASRPPATLSPFAPSSNPSK